MIEKEIKLYCQKTGQSEQSVRRRLAEGEPLQYILGEWEFYGLPFKVGKGVLIPQPDTEILVEQALNFVGSHSNVLDLCSGSGCIAIAINKMSGAKTTAVELYDEALCYLYQNITLNNAHVDVIKADVLQPPTINEKFDVIVSNPPYISYSEKHTLSKEVLNEPHTALFAEDDGYQFYHALKKYIPLLKEGGHFLFEIGYKQAEGAMEIFKQYEPEIIKDYSGNDRVIMGTYKGL